MKNAIKTEMTIQENILREVIFEANIFYGNNSCFEEILSNDTYETTHDKIESLLSAFQTQKEELYQDEEGTKNFLNRIIDKLLLVY